MRVFRSPDDAFSNLPDFPYEPNYLERNDLLEGVSLRQHYLDEGPRDATHTFLCLHGQPTWSFLYRKMIPIFTAAGGRVVAPDYFGFGRSDKPEDDAVYTFDFHRRTLLGFVEQLDLRNITLVCQDWGGIIGLTLPMAMPERFSRLIVMNTALPAGESPGEGFLQWRAYSASKRDMPVGKLMRRAVPHLSEAEAHAYDAPFTGEISKAGVRRFPAIVPVTPEMEGADITAQARTWWSESWSGPSFMAIGMKDPVLGPPAMRALHSMINACPPPLELADAGHFVQEWGDEVATRALASFEG